VVRLTLEGKPTTVTVTALMAVFPEALDTVRT
jgi:hypothetical protein